jgi:toxin ParE1/3/4
MKHYRVSEGARSDLDDIWSYIAQDNIEAVDKLIRVIIFRFPKLAEMPLIGRSREELSLGLRSFPVGRYIIFYRPLKNTIEIVRVLHGARDFPPLFE